MAVNYLINGVDLATLLAPTHSGWPQNTSVLYDSSGVDLSTIFAEAASGTAYGTTHFQHNGTDLGLLFAALGTTAVAVTSITAVSASSAAGTPSGTVTSNTTSVTAANGKQSGYTYTWTIASGSGIIFTGQGTSLTAVSATVNAGVTNSGTFYCAVSDGTTTTNTNSVAWSLHNTSSATWTLVASTVSYSGAGAFGGAGYVNGTYDPAEAGGSLTPVNVHTFPTERIMSISIAGTPTLVLTSIGAPTTSSITSVSFIDNHSVSRTFTTASASFASSAGGQTEWRWNLSYNVFTSGSTYNLTFV